ncbi:MAG TPA: hemerythrin domain-containing protein [Paucimonas sp.]|nr:hemerythrin domain-containing protein [Paucimonas sp.]
MLTATYSLITISAEQKNVRTILSRLREYIDSCLKSLEEPDLGKIESALNKLSQFDRYCHARKVEMYLIPSVRGMAHEIDALLAELESMSARAIEMLKSAQEKLRQAFEQGLDKIGELFRAMQNYCDNLLKRFAREEEELLPLLEQRLPGDQWFSIAAQFLSDDDGEHKRMHVPPPRLPAAP